MFLYKNEDPKTPIDIRLTINDTNYLKNNNNYLKKRMIKVWANNVSDYSAAFNRKLKNNNNYLKKRMIKVWANNVSDYSAAFNRKVETMGYKFAAHTYVIVKKCKYSAWKLLRGNNGV
ncbi:hypothetical protein QE152_g25104 [Popillia japonica]|uniref:Uncharacterized protein n=1 Tax=Popillia japonica TaxID=7064 RepID=A0AAW1K2K1_POPJA